MELLLVARATNTAERVVLTAKSDATVAEVASSLGEHLGSRKANSSLQVSRTGETLDPSATLGQVDLVSGDEVVVIDAPTTRVGSGNDAQAVLVLRTGPQAGERIEVARTITIGRDESADVAIRDALISRRHMSVAPAADNSVVVTDVGSSNGTVVNGSLISGPTMVGTGEVITIGATEIVVQLASSLRRASARRNDGLVNFSRPPRVAPEPIQREIRFPTPPEVVEARKIPLVATLAPLVLSGAMAYFVGPIMLVFALVSPLMMLANRWEDKRSGKAGFDRSMQQYAVDVEDAVAAARSAYEQSFALRVDAQPGVTEALARISTLDPRMWERRAEHADFLALRIGTSDQQSQLSITGGPHRDDDRSFAVSANTFIDSVLIDKGAPHLVNLMSSPALGVVGRSSGRTDLMSWLTVQAAAQCSPNDLAICVVAPGLSEWSWVSWLPHTRVIQLDSSLARSVAVDEDDSRALLSRIESIMDERSRRLQAKIGMETAADILPRLLVVIPDGSSVSDASMTQILMHGDRLGVSAIVGAESRDRMIGEVRQIADLAAGELLEAKSGKSAEGISFEGLSRAQAENASRLIAPLRDVTQRSAAGEIPESVLLLDLLDLVDCEPAEISSRWNANRGSKKLGADIGLSAAGVYNLDLRVHGPHGLVAGTTGAGKSELLQSIVAALAATHSPQRLNFVLIDYKGGAAFKDCVELPHTVGFFTDLDAHLALRALTSLNAELKKREHVLAEFGAKDIIELEEINPDKAPANLLIIFDEFAFLKRTVPEFVAGVIDIAQRGRSLGVHLLLATQRPSGVVDENIRANTNLRIALRVADDRDSEDVIERTDAVRIPKSLPGRAFIKTGPTAISQVQTAYANARRDVDDTSSEVTIASFDAALRMVPRVNTRQVKASSDSVTDLQRLVATIAQAAHDIPPQPVPWMDPLPMVVDVSDLDGNSRGSGMAVPIALADHPMQQSQDAWVCDLSRNGHLLVFGASGAGKSTALRTLAGMLATNLQPSDLHLYILDFGSRALGTLAELPHCGGVFTPEQPELVERTFARIERTIADRKAALGQRGFTSIDEARNAGVSMPYVVLMIDGYAAFNSTYQLVDHGEMNDRLVKILSDGRSVGVTVVLTADRRNAVPTAVSSLVPQRLVMRMGEIDEYVSLGLSGDLGRIEIAPGRAFLQDATELQVAVMGTDPSGASQSEMIRRIAKASNSDRAPERIEGLAHSVSLSSLESRDGVVPFAIEGDSGATLAVDLRQNPMFAVFGPERSGRTTTLATIVRGLDALGVPTRRFLVAPRRTELLEMSGWERVGRGTDGCDELLVELAAEVRERGETPNDLIVVVVDDGEELAEGASSSALAEIMRRGRDAGVVVLAAVSANSGHRSFGGWISDIKRARHAMLLIPDVDVDGDLVSVRLPRKSTRRFVPGRGYFVARGDVQYAQVALS